MGQRFLKTALELKLLTAEQVADLEGVPDPAAAVREARLLDSGALRQVEEAERAVLTPTRPSGRVIGKKAPPIASEDLTRTIQRDQPPLEEGPGFWAGLVPLPAEIGVYRVLGEVARGGMGIVVRAYHPGLDKQVAIKLLHPEAQGDTALEERFIREARAAAKLRHPGIVAVHDVARDAAGLVYLVMDLVEGESLKMRLERQGPLEPRLAATLVEQVARAVSSAHAQGILHRDLKPHNVLIDLETERPLLTDFGLAKAVGDTSDSAAGPRKKPAPADHHLTRTGEMIGTPLYMAPEQVDPTRGPTTVRSDVWGLGVVLYECLTGITPFDAPSSEEVFHLVVEEAPPPPSRFTPGLPPELEAIVLCCLEKNPALRYGSAEELANELRGWLTGARVLSKPRRAERASSLAALPWLALGLGVLGLAAYGWRERPPPPPAREPVAPPAPPAPEPPIALPEAKEPRGGLRLSPESITLGNVRRLAEAGYADAMLAYGWALASGQLGPADPVTGRVWMERAAEAGHAPAYRHLGQSLLEGDVLAADARAGVAWLERGAERGLVDCMVRAGWAHLAAGQPERARPWLERAVATGSTEAMLALGQAIQRDEPKRALELWERAAEGGFPAAMVLMGQVHEHGLLGQAADPVRARAWYERAQAAGAPEGRVRLEELERRGG